MKKANYKLYHIIINIPLIITISMILLAGSFDLIRGLEHIGRLFMLISFFISFSYLLFMNKVYIDKTHLFFILIYGFVMFVSAATSGFIQVAHLIFFPLLIYIYPNICKDKGMIIITKLFLITHIILIVIPLFLGINNSVYQSIYSGLFYNPNIFGQVLATLASIIIAVFLGELTFIVKKRDYRRVYILIIQFCMIILSLIGVFYSQSRTSFLAIVINIFLVSLIVCFPIIKNKKIKFKKKNYKIIKILVITITLISIIVIAVPFFRQIFVENIIDKFTEYSKQGNILTYRNYIWLGAIRDISLFGHGRGYFINNFGWAAHNSYISILGTYGLFSFILFIIILIPMIYYSSIYLIKKIGSNRKAFLPIVSLNCFLILSMAENMIFKVSMNLSFLLVGCAIFELIYKKNKNIEYDNF